MDSFMLAYLISLIIIWNHPLRDPEIHSGYLYMIISFCLLIEYLKY